MHRRKDPPEHFTAKALTLGIAGIALAACSSPTATPATLSFDNVKLPVDNGTYTKTPGPSGAGDSGQRPLPTPSATNPGDADNSSAEPVPQVTVTVTAQPTMNPVTDQPAVLRIPSFDVASDVVAVGLDSGGGVVVPEDISVTGWYDRSSWIGAPFGSIVLVGHRDSAIDGAGALYGIEELQTGDTVVLAAQDGQIHRFRIREIKSVEKARFSTIVDDVFRPDSPYRLTLITCGGAFDEAEGSYLSNIIVTAYPE